MQKGEYMNRNVESHFSELPSVSIERSMFDRSSSHKTSFNVGQLIPFYIDEVLPGDTFNITTSAVVRLQTPLTPIMDNMYMDTYFFFVPNRLVWEHWKQFMGENTESYWIPSTEYRVPRMDPPEGGWETGTIADYLGIPVGVDIGTYTEVGNSPNALPFRGYALIADTWFRDQNLTDPLYIYMGDSTVTGKNGTLASDIAKGGIPFRAAKYHDYFTSCLPSPQKGPNIGLWSNNLSSDKFYSWIPVSALAATKIANPHVDGSKRYPVLMQPSGDDDANTSKRFDVSADATGSNWTTINGTTQAGFTPVNLWANVGAMDLTINELRLAFQLQKFFEKNARAGTRYRELLHEHFGVVSPDARMMIPEYLGGHRFPLSIHQVANQSQGESDFLGDLGAMSNTSDVHEDFVKSFTEHGFVFGLCVVRYDHSYPQGLERFWSRVNNTDYYWPVFANIGEQPVYKREIYYSSSEANNDAVFGYQEAWADYRYKPSRVSGEMRPGIANSLATWHLADNYDSVPSLSNAWIREDKAIVDRVLSVTSSLANQVFADFYVQNICTRPMPMYSIPGLIDHH